MNRHKLEQYVYIKQEREDLKQRIKKLEVQLDKIEEKGVVVDKVRGGEGNLKSFRIEGFPYPEYNKKKLLLRTNLEKLQKAENKSIEMLNEIEEYISAIDDYLIVRIIRLRVIEGKSWNDVAQNIGGSTVDSVKKAYYRYVKG